MSAFGGVMIKALLRGIMNASLLQTDSLAEQVQSLLATVDRLRAEVDELRQENGELRQQVRELRCDVGYWKSLHARATQRNAKLQAELDQAKAEIRQLKAKRFGKKSEKQSSVDRSNQLVDPENPTAPKNKRGQQPGQSPIRHRRIRGNRSRVKCCGFQLRAHFADVRPAAVQS